MLLFFLPLFFFAVVFLVAALRFGAAFFTDFLRAVVLEAALLRLTVRLAVVLFFATRFFVLRALVDEDARRRWSLNMALPPIVYLSAIAYSIDRQTLRETLVKFMNKTSRTREKIFYLT